MRAKVDITASHLRCILILRTRWEKMYSEGRDFGDMLASCERRRCAVHNCRRCKLPASGAGGNRDGTRASSPP